MSESAGQPAPSKLRRFSDINVSFPRSFDQPWPTSTASPLSAEVAPSRVLFPRSKKNHLVGFVLVPFRALEARQR